MFGRFYSVYHDWTPCPIYCKTTTAQVANSLDLSCSSDPVRDLSKWSVPAVPIFEGFALSHPLKELQVWQPDMGLSWEMGVNGTFFGAEPAITLSTTPNTCLIVLQQADLSGLTYIA